mgnify:CR=1 FL=1
MNYVLCVLDAAIVGFHALTDRRQCYEAQFMCVLKNALGHSRHFISCMRAYGRCYGAGHYDTELFYFLCILRSGC